MLTSGDVRREPFAAQPYGIDAEVDQQLGPVREPERDGVRGGRGGHHFSVAGRHDLARERLDREPVAHHALGEDRVGHGVQTGRPPVHRRTQQDAAHGAGRSWTEAIVQSGFTPVAV